MELKTWKMDALPYLVYAPIKKLPKEKEIIRSLKNLAKKADSIIIATDFDREGELIGSDALSCIQEVNPDAPVQRARYSAFTKEEITHAFDNLVELDVNLASAGASRQDIDLIWGAVAHALPDASEVRRLRQRALVGPRADAHARPHRGEGARAPGVRARGLLGDPRRVRRRSGRVRGPARHGSLQGGGPRARAVMAHVEGATTARVSGVEKKKRTVQPPAPFNTTSLMAAASAEGLSPARTMRIAESLYMDGYISYPRVDNTVYPSSLDLADTVKAISGQPRLRAVLQGAAGEGRAQGHARQEGDDGPPAPSTPRPRPRPTTSRRPTTSCTTSSRGASWPRSPRRPSSRGTKVSLDVNGEPFVAKGDVLVRPGFRAHLPLRPEERRAAARARGGRDDRVQTAPPARRSRPSRPRATARASSSRRWRSWAWARSPRATPSSSASTR